MIQVFGQGPSTPISTWPPIIWAWYLSDIRKQPAKAVLLGEPNTEAA